jgi:hypothetical protein
MYSIMSITAIDGLSNYLYCPFQLFVLLSLANSSFRNVIHVVSQFCVLSQMSLLLGCEGWWVASGVAVFGEAGSEF